MVDTLSTNILFEWDCLGKIEPQSRIVLNSTKYYSVITHTIHLSHDGDICRCCINVDGIRGNSEISIAISSEYITVICTSFNLMKYVILLSFT